MDQIRGWVKARTEWREWEREGEREMSESTKTPNILTAEEKNKENKIL